MTRRLRGVSLVALALVATTSTAHGFCRTTTCNRSTDDARCEPDENGCSQTGQPLFWGKPCSTFSVQEEGSVLRNISYDTAQTIAGDVFQRWTSAGCEPGLPKIGVVSTGPVSCRHAEYNTTQLVAGAVVPAGPNANVILFLDEAWPYPGTEGIIALTTVTFNANTGEIYDADIEVNSASNVLTTGDSAGEVQTDLETVLVHEVGHFFGLEHSDVDGAAMFPEYDTGQLRRGLSDDDEAGVCAIYPAGDDGENRECPADTEPRHGFSPDCGGDLKTAGNGCGVAYVSARTARPRWFLVIGCLLAAACQRPCSASRRLARQRSG